MEKVGTKMAGAGVEEREERCAGRLKNVMRERGDEGNAVENKRDGALANALSVNEKERKRETPGRGGKKE